MAASIRVVLFIAATLVVSLRAGERALIDTTRSPHARIYLPNLGDVKLQGGLLGERFEVCRATMVPHMWTIFKDDNESHAWSNFLIAAGLGHGRDGKFHGPPFNDGDFLKWFEALAQIYAVTREPAWDAQMDEIIAVLAKAQREDGYLHTQKIIPQRQGDPAATEFEEREHFETYNMGHLMTAACMHFRATGKTTLLTLARKAADYLDRLCTAAPADLARNAICPSHYMGVVELYRATREPRYLELAKKLIEIRRLVPPAVGSDQNQDRVPIHQQTEAVGHAVRANYLYAGVADVFAESGDASLLRSVTAIADDVATQKLYFTGMTGALYDGASPDGSNRHSSIKTVHQAYGRDYQLPNLTAYNETCATIGFAMWVWRMFTATGEARYADLFEQSLYNGVLAGISLEGTHYFYVNPLRKLDDFQWPLRWSRSRTTNIKSSFCCPPNVVRTIAEAPNYVYALSPGAVWVNLYAASTLDSTWTDGARIKLRQETDYPWNGRIKVSIEEAPPRVIAVKLRIPGWLRDGNATVRVNAAPSGGPRPGAYFEISREWKAGDVIDLSLDFAPALWEASPLVEETLNQAAVRCGPLVYCVESRDLPAGVRVMDVAFASGETPPKFTAERARIVNSDVLMWSVPAIALQRPMWRADQLYRELRSSSARSLSLRLVPYFAWGNRGDGEMSVWLPVR